MLKKYMGLVFGVFLLYPTLAVSRSAGLECEICYSYVAASRNAVFYTSSNDEFVKLDARTGRPLWTSTPLPKVGLVGYRIVVLDSHVYFGLTAPCGPVEALWTDTGKVAWSKNYYSCFLGSDGKRLYLQAQGGDGLYALDPTTGKVLWQSPGTTPNYISVISVDNGRVYTNDRVIDARTGQALFWWPKYGNKPIPFESHPSLDQLRKPVFYGILKAAEYVTSLMAAGPRVFTGRHGILTAYDAATLKIKYRFTQLEKYKIKSLSASSKYVYVEGYARNDHSRHFRQGILVALGARNGLKRWSYRFLGSCPGISTDGSGVFLLQAARGQSCTELVALNEATGKRMWSFRSAQFLYAPPVPHGKRIYVPNSEKGAQIGLIALNSSTGKVLWVYNPTHE